MRRRGIGAIVVACGLAGCSGNPGKPDELLPVSGQVTYHGRPLAGGMIAFTPDEERGGSGPMAKATVGEDGRFELASGDRSGTVAGWHRVTVAGAPNQAGPPARFRDPSTSGLKCEVKKDGERVFVFRLEE